MQKQKRDKFQNVRKIGKLKRRKPGEKVNQHLKKKKENQNINKQKRKSWNNLKIWM